MNEYVYDIVILAVLVVIGLWGAHRGLVLSLFSLLALVVAMVGASLVSRCWTNSVAGWVQPLLTPTVTAAVQAALPEQAGALSAEDALLLLENAGLPLGLDHFLDGLAGDGVLALTSESLVDSIASALSEELAQAIASTGLFLLSFVLILLLWRLLGRALDLVVRLPGLHALNRVGGFLLGALRGALVLFACAWVVRQFWSGLVPEEAVERSALLRFFWTTDPVELVSDQILR